MQFSNIYHVKIEHFNILKLDMKVNLYIYTINLAIEGVLKLFEAYNYSEI